MRIIEEDSNAALADWMTKAMGIGFLLWLALTAFYLGTRQGKTVWRGTVDKDGLLVETVKLDSLEPYGTLELEVYAGKMTNGWVGVHCALINPKTEKASYLYKEVEFWSGSGWKDGKRKGSQLVTGVPNGTYMMQLELEPKSKYQGPVTVKLHRDVVLWRYPVCTFFLVFAIPLLVLLGQRSRSGGGWGKDDDGGGWGAGGFVAASGGGGYDGHGGYDDDGYDDDGYDDDY